MEVCGAWNRSTAWLGINAWRWVGTDAAADCQCVFDKRSFGYHEVVYVWTNYEIARMSIYPLISGSFSLHLYVISSSLRGLIKS
jgi:hypothetical protein